MKKMLLIASIFFLFGSGEIYAQNEAITGFCVKGATPAITSGLNSTNTLEGIVPGGPAGCLVQVYETGTTTPATIFSTITGGTLDNPFRASLSGQWLFFVISSNKYDVVLSGGLPPNAYTTPVTLTGLGSGGGGGSCPVGATGYFQINASGVCAASTIDEGQVNPFTTTTTDGAITLQAVFNSPNGTGTITLNASPTVINSGDPDVVDVIADGEDGEIFCTDSASTNPSNCPTGGSNGPITLYSGQDISLRPEGDFIANSLGGGVTIESESTTSGGDILLSAGPGTSGSVADIELEADRNIDIDAAGAGGAGVVEMSGDSLNVNMPVNVHDTESGLASQWNLIQNGIAPATVANATSIAAPTVISNPSVLVLPTTPCVGYLQAATDTSGIMPLTCGTASQLFSLRGTVTFTTATSDSATVTGVTSSSNCVAFPTNATAAANTTVIAYISSVSANTVTFTHVATTASGGTENIACTVN